MAVRSSNIVAARGTMLDTFDEMRYTDLFQPSLMLSEPRSALVAWTR